MKAFGIWIARAVLVFTGNLTIAACLKALPAIGVLPFRVVKIEGEYLTQYPSSPQEWGEWQKTDPHAMKVAEQIKRCEQMGVQLP